MFWSFKQKRESDQFVISEQKCPICNTISQHEMIGVQKYFSLYGISFFPTSKVIYRSCNNCKVVKEITYNEFNTNIDENSVDHLFSVSLRWRYFTGLYLIGILLSVIVFFVVRYG